MNGLGRCLILIILRPFAFIPDCLRYCQTVLMMNSLIYWHIAQKNIVMVLHINHANEIDNALAQKCQTLKKHGVVLLNQSVLLKGVNDNVEILCQLSHALFDIGVLPYYLHILDKVAGSAHFDLPTDRAIQIYWQLLEKLSGYLVPKLVQEVAGKPYKVPIDIYKNC